MTIKEAEIWFANNKTEFDVSATGFSWWLEKYHPELLIPKDAQLAKSHPVIKEDPFAALSTERIKELLEQANRYIEFSRSLVSWQGGWILWDSQKQADTEKEVRIYQQELIKRK